MWVGVFSLLYKMGYIAGGCISSTGRAKPDLKVFAGDWGEKILKVGAMHIISNCRVLKTLKFAAAEPLEKALQSVSKTSRQQYQNPFVGLTFMVSWWVFCQEPPHIRIGNFLLSFSQQPCLRSWAPAEKMLQSCFLYSLRDAFWSIGNSWCLWVKPLTLAASSCWVQSVSLPLLKPLRGWGCSFHISFAPLKMLVWKWHWTYK